MTQGIFVKGRRPKSKKEIKEYVERINLASEHGHDPEAISHLAQEAGLSTADFDPYGIVIEATSLFGNEYDGSLANAPKTARGYTFVGPDPHTSRKFYGTISWNESKSKWVVK